MGSFQKFDFSRVTPWPSLTSDNLISVFLSSDLIYKRRQAMAQWKMKIWKKWRKQIPKSWKMLRGNFTEAGQTGPLFAVCGSQTWSTISSEHFCWKKCFNFGCPSLGHNSEFWFYHQKCHFFVSTFRNLSDHKRFNWGTKIKILWLHSKKMSPQRESRFWSKNVKL